MAGNLETTSPEDLLEDFTTTLKVTSSVLDYTSKRIPFGSRFLTENSDVWSQNAWDHVPPPEDQSDRINVSLTRQKAKPVPETDKSKYNDRPQRHWNNFYKMNADNFFRDRNWLHTEFPELVAATKSDAGPMTIVELGCGAGNSVFPLLASNQNPKLCIHAFDYASHAVKLVQHNPLYLDPPVGTIRASVWDITTNTALPPDLKPQSADIIILIFVLSALHPDEWVQTITNVHTILKPGGLVVFRDYGRYDLAQLRFKEGRLLDENFYIRGDKTRVYFFEPDELALLFTGSGIVPAKGAQQEPIIEYESADEERKTDVPSGRDYPGVGAPSRESSLNSLHTPEETLQSDSTPDKGVTESPEVQSTTGSPDTQPNTPPVPNSSLSQASPFSIKASSMLRHPLFKIEQLGVDRRLLVNRKRQLKMYRVWMQGKFRKL